jgi:hypothetical protein
LALGRGVDQGAVALDEETNAVGAKFFVGQGVRYLKLGFEVVEGGADVVELNFVVFADGPQNVDLD